MRVTSTLWSLRWSVGTDWGLQCQLFLRLVYGVALPSLFYRAPCWASVVSMGARLEELDCVLAMASRMAFSLERFTSTEGLLVLGGLRVLLACTSCAPLFIIYSGTGELSLSETSFFRALILRDSGGDWLSLVLPCGFGALFGGPHCGRGRG